ncbi:carbohydrate porin [Plectonema cf. radiosum LEGE 06105]|uniref:Carbohydrate porin n=1 Tax=Plectonema cf. radiosum LEGE 06105 TaxID=945769 RepID=A0A8J7K2A0_9CYAN|nr:carbohydrate porin [Plectonema radiosum]MBE9213862.1 carbohydrate porin [Plectonema cf. radiosum LEGE 06105]
MKLKILESQKLIFIKEFHKHKSYVLFCAASMSVLGTLGLGDRSQAQLISSQKQENKTSYSGDLLRVPQSSIPSGRTKLRSKEVPPPPNVSPIGATLPTEKPATYAPLDNIKQLENSFIQEEITGKTKRLIEQSIAIGGSQTEIAQAVPFPAPPGSNSQEFTQVAPLPPLPGVNVPQQSDAGYVPTFNQLLNSTIGFPLEDYGNKNRRGAENAEERGKERLGLNPVPTFEQMLDAYRRSQPQVSATSAPLPTFNQLLNSQGGMLPSAPLTTSQQLGTTPIIPTASQISQGNNQLNPLRTSAALRESSLQVQGVFVTQGDDTSARARLTGVYPLTPQVLFGATLDLTSEGSSFDDSRREGLNINELYLATSLSGLPNLRFAVGQLDLTSYFDRNSFAKDGASQFFNPVFQTNPALAATGISSKPGLLVNWSVTDNIDAKAAVFSSSDSLSEFALDGFAGEVGVRYGNAIIRGTYSTARDAGNRDSFPESFQIARGNDRFGVLEDDREEAYGLNAEVFIPSMKLGLFGRYGRYENRDLGEGADTYVIGASLLDLFTPDDRLGLAYGRGLSNDEKRQGKQLDVLELYYDFQFLPNLRLGFSVQGRDDFNETVLGVRVKSDFDVTPRGRFAR